MHSDIFPISYKCFLYEKLERDGLVGFKKYSKDISTLGYTVIAQYSMCVLLVLISLSSTEMCGITNHSVDIGSRAL